jgi:hypothetical protein
MDNFVATGSISFPTTNPVTIYRKILERPGYALFE